MKIWLPLLLSMGVAQAASGAEPDFSSPYDTNPRCSERTTDGNSPECLVKDDAGPVVVRPPVTTTPTPPTTKPTPTPPGATIPGKPGGGTPPRGVRGG